MKYLNLTRAYEHASMIVSTLQDDDGCNLAATVDWERADLLFLNRVKVIPICFVKLRFNALERAKRGMSEIMCGSDFTAL